MKSIVIDVTNTSQVNSNTGIQKFTREFFYELKKYFLVTPVRFDFTLNKWRCLDKNEEVKLELNNPKFKIGSCRNVKSGSLKPTFLSSPDPDVRPLPNEAYLFITTEVFKEATALKLRYLWKKCRFKKTLAVLHDSIPLEFPNLTYNKLYFYFYKYIKHLLKFNLIISVSEASILKLVFLLKKNCIYIKNESFLVLNPEVSYYVKPNIYSRYSSVYVVAISSLEKRKNYVSLLKSLLVLWKENYKIKLILIGGLVNEYSIRVKSLISTLIAKKYPIYFFKGISEKKLLYVYTKVNVLTYPSVTEGFGIPIIENNSFNNVVITGRGGSLLSSNRRSFLRLNTVGSAFLTKKVASIVKSDNYLFYLKNSLLSSTVYGWSNYIVRLLYEV